jgi:hypothetical protein
MKIMLLELAIMAIVLYVGPIIISTWIAYKVGA